MEKDITFPIFPTILYSMVLLIMIFYKLIPIHSQIHPNFF